MTDASAAPTKRPRRIRGVEVPPDVPAGKRLLAVEKSDETRVVFLVPVAARTVRDAETQGIPVAIRYGWGSEWHVWPGAPILKMRRKQFAGVPLAEPTPGPLSVGVAVSIDAVDWSALGATRRRQFASAGPGGATLVWRKIPGAFETGPITDSETLDMLRALATQFGVGLVEERRS